MVNLRHTVRNGDRLQAVAVIEQAIRNRGHALLQCHGLQLAATAKNGVIVAIRSIGQCLGNFDVSQCRAVSEGSSFQCMQLCRKRNALQLGTALERSEFNGSDGVGQDHGLQAGAVLERIVANGHDSIAVDGGWDGQAGCTALISRDGSLFLFVQGIGVEGHRVAGLVIARAAAAVQTTLGIGRAAGGHIAAVGDLAGITGDGTRFPITGTLGHLLVVLIVQTDLDRAVLLVDDVIGQLLRALQAKQRELHLHTDFKEYVGRHMDTVSGELIVLCIPDVALHARLRKEIAVQGQSLAVKTKFDLDADLQGYFRIDRGTLVRQLLDGAHIDAQFPVLHAGGSVQTQLQMVLLNDRNGAGQVDDQCDGQAANTGDLIAAQINFHIIAGDAGTKLGRGRGCDLHIRIQPDRGIHRGGFRVDVVIQGSVAQLHGNGSLYRTDADCLGIHGQVQVLPAGGAHHIGCVGRADLIAGAVLDEDQIRIFCGVEIQRIRAGTQLDVHGLDGVFEVQILRGDQDILGGGLCDGLGTEGDRQTVAVDHEGVADLDGLGAVVDLDLTGIALGFDLGNIQNFDDAFFEGVVIVVVFCDDHVLQIGFCIGDHDLLFGLGDGQLGAESVAVEQEPAAVDGDLNGVRVCNGLGLGEGVAVFQQRCEACGGGEGIGCEFAGRRILRPQGLVGQDIYETMVHRSEYIIIVLRFGTQVRVEIVHSDVRIHRVVKDFDQGLKPLGTGDHGIVSGVVHGGFRGVFDDLNLAGILDDDDFFRGGFCCKGRHGDHAEYHDQCQQETDPSF